STPSRRATRITTRRPKRATAPSRRRSGSSPRPDPTITATAATAPRRWAPSSCRRTTSTRSGAPCSGAARSPDVPDGTVLRITGVRKQYNALRPLRLNDLVVAPGERVAISGLDAGAAEVFVNLVTGASVPDEGDVLVEGRSTSAIADGDQWLASLDRF